MLKSNYHKLLPALALAIFNLAPAHGDTTTTATTAAPKAPQRSDWLNVKTDASPKAIGDGVHDDTAAIQAGMNALDRSYGFNAKKTLYLPAGTYRISRTLTLDKIYGAAIIGQGRATRIVWNGPRLLPMYVSNGASHSRYVGLTWDGAGKAGVGIDHQSHNLYETGILHQDEAFLNFKIAGIRNGYNGVTPSSELSYRNCLFQNCTSGVVFLNWNAYNNDFAGCEFEDNGTAINCLMGNIGVRDCHFERSTVADIFLCAHTHSISRCTSTGSRQFIKVPHSGALLPVAVQDCHIDGWTGSEGAMDFGMRGPTTIFDCSFTHPPDTKTPIRLTNFSDCPQTVILSNNSAPSSSALVVPTPREQISNLPPGERGASLSDPNQSFQKSIAPLAKTILDVKTQFGAKGIGRDDTTAVINALNAASALGNNAVVYFPAGKYCINKTLPVVGSGYRVEGSGYMTQIDWSGASGGAVFGVQDAKGVTLSHFRVTAPVDVAAIRQTSVAALPSQVTYEDITVGGTVRGPDGKLATSQVSRGLECVGLPVTAVVSLDNVTGTTHFSDCSRATILGGFVQGVIEVDGADYEKTGFLGVLAHNTALNLCDVIIRDNQDFVGTNFYTESTQSALFVSGDGALPGQPGHVTIQGSKTQTFDPTAIRIDDYEGRVTYADGALYSSTLPTLMQTGTRPVDVVLLGNGFTGVQPILSVNGGQLTSIANYSTGGGIIKAATSENRLPSLTPTQSAKVLAHSFAANEAGSEPMDPAVAALDDFRQLGAYDLAINYPQL